MTLDEARNKLLIPSVVLFVLCGLNVLQIGGLVMFMVFDAELRAEATGDSAGMVAVLVAWFASSFIATGLVAYGTFRMMRATSYPWALCAAMLVLLPNVMIYCWLISLPVGIWALALLFNKDVRGVFPGRHQISDTFD